MTDEAQPIVNGRYRVERSVGRGGMAEVFLAHDTLLDRPIALKVLFPEYATDPAFVERFRREAQAAAGLQHPHIVAVYDWGKVNNTYFIAMEYVSGKTLAEILKDRKQLTHTQAADIARDVASALGFAHDNGVVHRDIKPGNILVRADGVVKVADFGIARALDSSTDEALTQTGLVMGTAAYLSPEQAQGAQPDPRSDLYSLGVVMYEMVGGRPPYVGDSSLSVAYQHVHAVPEPLKKLNQFVPLEFEAVVAKCMAKSADKRYQTGQALIDDLRRVEEGSDVQALSTLRSTARDESPLTTQAIPVVTPTLSEQPTAEHEVFDNSARRTARYVFGSAVGFVILLAVIVIGIRALTNGGGLVDVPDTVGMQYAQAEQVIIDAGLTPVGNPQPSDGIEPGVVYAQEPGTGERVDTGTRILITYQPTETVT
ncbi:MAG: Stk1 family PASTA domain-containing Ser/Thr kinase, partial [Ilumatobacteraceae bacterium]